MPETATLAEVIARFGAAAKAKFASVSISGEREEQLRAPLEALLADLSLLLNRSRGDLVAIGETLLSAAHTKPDYAIQLRNALVGFIEVKAPGKGADPRRFRDEHDRKQWERLRHLPNLMYTDGNAFSLWRSGALAGEIVLLDGDVTSSGARLTAPDRLLSLFADFLNWQPIPPASPRALAETSAGLCRLLREEVAEQLEQGNAELTGLKNDWGVMLFPGVTNAQFADGYAQAVTFGLLMARARGVALDGGLDRIAKRLSRTDTLIGRAFELLTKDMDEEEGGGAAPTHHALRTSLATLTRVLNAVDWAQVSKGNPEAWLYFYEHFLEVYDNRLRKLTGSYYTPPEVVAAMVRLVDDALRDPARFGIPKGLASEDVTLADPAMGTGTYLLGVLRHIAERAAEDGAGNVPAVITGALQRLIGFELQFGPFAVAQLRLLAEVVELLDLKGTVPANVRPRLHITDTLGNPYAEEQHIPQIFAPIAESRRQANKLKRAEPITVVIGNPPYKERAKGKGGWVESGSGSKAKDAPLLRWMPPPAWRVSAHAKHLRNLYVYFWRWATWKVFGDNAGAEQAAKGRRGIVSFITVAGFLNGPGFQKMRADLRETADEIWVVDCSPEGHQPEVATRIFQGVQQPVCIVMMARTRADGAKGVARVRYRALPAGRREEKFAALATLSLDDDGWTEAPTEPRAPFLPALVGGWASFPALDALFAYNGSGVMPGRVWPIAPDRDSLTRRWKTLQGEKDPDRRAMLFHPHLRKDGEGDKHLHKVVKQGLHLQPMRSVAVADDPEPEIPPVRYAFRSFDRQWVIPDARLLNQPNPTLWEWQSAKQVFLTALTRYAPRTGPALTITACIPDLDHYRGSFGGRAFPLWADAAGTAPNFAPGLLSLLAHRLGHAVTGEDVVAYIAAIAAHPAYTARFAQDLRQPGLRIPLTADAALWKEAVELGRAVVWLHCFGERFADARAGRPPGAPRLPAAERPTIPKEGAIPGDAARMPDALRYDASQRRLFVGEGFVDNVPPAVWAYEVSGKQVLVQWFSYRRKTRERPLIGDRRKPSPLADIQPDHWLPEYTDELLNVLNVLGHLVRLEPAQAALLERVCAGKLVTAGEVAAAAEAAPKTEKAGAKRGRPRSRDARQDGLDL